MRVLIELEVRNLGVIERALLDLSGQMEALTGETGAGKTMVVEALQLLAGGRADPARVRSRPSKSCPSGAAWPTQRLTSRPR